MATALVTGTSSGIGLATAVALARAGHTVAATMRNLDGGAEIRRTAEEEKLPIHLAALDVEDDASEREAFAQRRRVQGTSASAFCRSTIVPWCGLSASASAMTPTVRLSLKS